MVCGFCEQTKAFVPLIAGFIVLEKLGYKSSRLELRLMVNYINWYEIGSHSGKPMPTVG